MFALDRVDRLRLGHLRPRIGRCPRVVLDALFSASIPLGHPSINPLSMLGDILPAMHQVHVPLTGALREYTLE
ncbi:MAG: hypothetical protein ACLFNA_04595 [Halochromatium sp.]|uniref:hypothetical protein n=1 Tax=Halochromatium sp. TaxID=2049430 RepID=UPI003979F85D